MKMHSGLMVCVSAVCAFAAVAQSGLRGSSPEEIGGKPRVVEPNLHVEEFGVTEGKPITNGFVFVDGRYLEAPYKVVRKGLGIYINNALIETIPWTGEPKPIEDIDPEMPPGITKDTSFYDSNLKDFLWKKTMYLHKHYGREQAVRMLYDVYKKMPCYKNVNVDAEDKTLLHITTFNGETYNVGLAPLPGRLVDMTKAGVLKRANVAREGYEARLGMGDYYMFSQTGGLITGGVGGAAELLPKLLPILRSGKDEAAKFKELQQAGLPDVKKDSFAEIVTNFSASPQLEQRLNALVKSNIEQQK